LLALAALLFVGDVGVRRVRITGPEIRAAYYAVRRRLGYVDTPAEAPHTAMRPVPSGFGLVSGQPVARVRARDAAAPPPPTRQGRLLAAKQRAARR
jgi:hypothetical protein